MIASKILCGLIWAAMLLVLALLALTSLPAISGEPLHGNVLLAHMIASGAMVALLPLVIWFYPRRSKGLSKFSAFLFAAFGLVSWLTIATMFIGMLPLASTPLLAILITWHGWLGYGSVGLAILLLFFGFRSQRKVK